MAKRTTPLGKIFNNFTCCCCIILLSLYLQFTTILATEDEEASTSLNATSAETNATFLTPVAEALVRYRRHPLTIVKHIIRPRRIKVKRVKRPKIKYSFAEPPPQIYYKSSSKPPAIKHAPIFDSSIFEDFSHINVESADFDAPPSSYEAQSMDLDLYSSYEAPKETHYKSTKTPTYTYTEPEVIYKEHTQIPTYSYEAPKKAVRKPHTEYGVPKEFVYSTGYEKHSDNSFTYNQPSKIVEKPKYHQSSYEPSNQVIEHPKYEAPPKFVEKPTYFRPEEDKYSYTKPQEDKYSYTKSVETPRIPATTYGIPDMPIPAKNFDNYNKYSIIEHQPASYDSFESIKSNQHHFAEPPAHEQNVQIMYSPSYEINIPSPDEQYHEDYKTHHHHHQQQQYETPPKHRAPSSAYQESSDTHQPPSYEPAPPQDLPINHNHKHPTYDYPKSSYEVPIYDPIPFDSSNNQEREIYPPQSFDSTSWKEAAGPEYVAEPNNVSEQRPNPEKESQHIDLDQRPAGDTHSSGTRPTTDVIPPRSQRGHKRKRTKGSTPTTISSTIHILDVPELQQAFENEKRQQQQTTDTDINESHKVENINHGRWNPMKLRTPSMIMTSSSSSSSSPAPPTSAVNHQYNKANIYRPQQQRPRASTSTTTQTTPLQQQHSNNLQNVEIVSIQKSRSKSYYDGILSTPKIYNPNLYRNRYRTQQQPTSSTTTAAPQTIPLSKERFSKRTTKNVFDTTIFKSPVNDRDVYRNLPKNHKLY